MQIFDWPLWLDVVVLVVAGIVIVYAGTRLARIADVLADRTGMGEAITGALLLGASTSLPGIVTTATAAAGGYPSLAMSNAIGGIAAQTAFLAVADFFNRRINLEHAAPSVPNLLNATLLIVLLGVVLLTVNVPAVTFLGVHPVTPVLLLAYLGGLRLAQHSVESPQWLPRRTRFTREDEPEPDKARGESTTRPWVRFSIFALLTGASGFFVGQTGIGIVRQTGISESVVGGLITAITTSTPELITAVAAVRHGALQLAVGDVIGGNAFDVMMAVVADAAFRGGSIYHAIAPGDRMLAALTIVMTGVLVLGLIRREQRGIANIGFESALILLLYALGVVLLIVMGEGATR